MRFGGAGIPFSQNAFPVHLYSGHTYQLPAGNYLVDLGRVSLLQTFDVQNYLWRTLKVPGNKLQITSDGGNFRIINPTGTVTGAAITTAGTGGTNGIGPTATGCTVSFGSAPSNGRAATAYAIIGGAINSTVTVTTAGSGYLVPPTIYFDPPPPGGIQATGYAVLSGTTISSITVTNQGAGYITAPNCYAIPQFSTVPGINNGPYNNASTTNIFTAPTIYGLTGPIPGMLQNVEGLPIGAGSGAVLTVNSTLASSGFLTGIVMTDYGATYTGTTIPTISFTGGPTSAAATAIMNFSLTSVTVSNAGVAVSVAPMWMTSDGLVQASDGAHGTYIIRPAVGISTLSSTTTTIITSLTVEDPGFGLQKVPVVGFMPAGGTAWTTQPAGTAVCGGITDTVMIQPAVS